MVPTTIDLDRLTREQLVGLVRHYEEALDATVATHNGLLRRLEAAGADAVRQREVLNAWSVTVNGVLDASAAEIERIASPTTRPN